VPRTTGLAPRGFHSVSKALSELVAPATDRLVGHDHPALEEQFLDVTQAQLEAEGQRMARLMTSAGKR